MQGAFTRSVARTLPQPVRSALADALLNLQNARARWEARQARKVFNTGRRTPVWLDRGLLETLQQKYPFPSVYRRDPESCERRGQERAAYILTLSRKTIPPAEAFLELGCWDGMVSCCLQRSGKSTTAIDIRSQGLDERVRRGGTTFCQADAAKLPFANESFDFVLSYNSFEHFLRPDAVLEEAIRVTRLGGLIYLSFGHLYSSYRGLHAFRIIPIPYIHYLFPKAMLVQFLREQGLRSIRYDNINGWTLHDYRRLWARHAHQLKQIRYREVLDSRHVDLIEQYPSCFRSKADSFESLIVSGIQVLLERIR